MKALIIGINGFVGRYLKNELAKNGYKVFGADVIPKEKSVFECNILDIDSVRSVINNIRPDVIFHMAGQSSVAKSWANPALTFDLNVKGTVNLLEAVKDYDNSIKILLVGSSDQYGKIDAKNCIVNESVPLRPVTPYAISKCTQEELGRLYADSYGMNIYMTRSFNHIGAGQNKGFVIPDIASGIAEIEAEKSNKLYIGNVSVKRDFCDVRDVVRAYRLILEKGNKGEVYNVGSGKSYCIQDLMEKLVAMSESDIIIEKDLSRMRPSEVPSIQCDYSKLNKDSGWSPQICIEETLKMTLEYFRAVVNNEG